MNIKLPTKINLLLQRVPPKGIYLSSWMNKNGISYGLQRHYKESHWLAPVGTGAFVRTGEIPSIYGAVWSLNEQAGKHFSIAAMSALEIHGFAHYLPMGKQTLTLFSPKGEPLPTWFTHYDWPMIVRSHFTDFLDKDEGMTQMTLDGFPLQVSSPERAFMECLHLAPRYYNITDLYYVMETLSILRPLNVQTLLEKCKSVKVRRLFLYMAEKAEHNWFNALDLSKIPLGSGKRMIVKNGTYNHKYQITIPKDLANAE
jgi:Protein of unknwon function (DUF2893).